MRVRSLATISLLTLTGAALAQSSVTIFGVLDLSYQYVTAGNDVAPGVSGQHIHRLEGGQYTLTANRLGFRFTEDLGGGISAGGVLEAGLLPDTGAAASATQFWNRQTYVSLGASSLGEVRLGRQYRFQDETLALTNPFNNGTILGLNYGYRSSGPLGSPGDFIPVFVDNARVDNAVQYLSPAFGGIKGQVMVAAGEGVAPSYHGLRLSYVQGPVVFAAAFEAEGSSPLPRAKLLTVGGSVDLGLFKLVGGYQRGRDLNANMVGAPTNPMALSDSIVSYQHTTTYTVGVRKDVGAFALGANYGHVRFDNSMGQDRSLGRAAAGASYSLSRQTRLFVAYGQSTGDLAQRVIEHRLFQAGINKLF
ncbi:porin [Aquabacterium sp.]|uniref:porin n=1 Tax=Aquabacterium sp. TaxID=1872578 RepID=UPI00403842CF